MSPPENRALKDQLRHMDEQLMSLIALADEQEDYYLGALLCEAHAHVVKHYTQMPCR